MTAIKKPIVLTTAESICDLSRMVTRDTKRNHSDVSIVIENTDVQTRPYTCIVFLWEMEKKL